MECLIESLIILFMFFNKLIVDFFKKFRNFKPLRTFMLTNTAGYALVGSGIGRPHYGIIHVLVNIGLHELVTVIELENFRNFHATWAWHMSYGAEF